MTLRDEILAEASLYAYWGVDLVDGATSVPDLSPVPARPGVISPGAGLAIFPAHGVQGGSVGAAPTGTDAPGGSYPITGTQDPHLGISGTWPKLASGVGQTDWTFECCVAPMEYSITLPAEATSGTAATSNPHFFLTPANEGAANGGTGISIGTNGIVVAEHGTNYLPALLTYTAALTARVFLHLVLTCSNRQYKLYLGGTLVRTGLTSVRTLSILSNQLLVCPWSGMSNAYLDEVAWYTGLLSGARITAHAAAFAAQWPATQKMPVGIDHYRSVDLAANKLGHGSFANMLPPVDLTDGPASELGFGGGQEGPVYTRRPGSRFTTFPRVA